MIARLVLGAAAALVAAPALATEPGAGSPPVVPETAYTFGSGEFVVNYVAPPPGTYQLPPIDTVGDHELVDAEGKRATLAKVIGDRYAVVSFIYGTCNEANGCPMSTALLHRLDAQLAATPATDVALISISFDPQRDTPERLAQMQRQRAPRSTWQFLTAPGEASLAPMLEDFGQTISRLRNADGTWTGIYRHVLKVFLLDRQRRVRNIYSAGYLDAAIIRNDIETLRMEEAH